MTAEETRRPTALVVTSDDRRSAMGTALLDGLDITAERLRSADDAIERMCGLAGQVDLVLADIHLDGRHDAVALARRIDVLWPNVSVIITGTDDRTGLPAGLPSRTVYIADPRRPLDVVAAAEKAVRADHSLRSVRL